MITFTLTMMLFLSNCCHFITSIKVFHRAFHTAMCPILKAKDPLKGQGIIGGFLHLAWPKDKYLTTVLHW
jgi:hypothetical protein